MLSRKGKESEDGFGAGCRCDNCDYRSLYEGALASLSEMSSNHRRALERVGHIKEQLARTFAQSYPRQARDLERALGGRLADMDESQMLSALSRAAGSRSSMSASFQEEMRAKIAETGLDLPQDVASWPHAIAAALSAARPGERDQPFAKVEPRQHDAEASVAEADGGSAMNDGHRPSEDSPYSGSEKAHALPDAAAPSTSPQPKEASEPEERATSELDSPEVLHVKPLFALPDPGSREAYSPAPAGAAPHLGDVPEQDKKNRKEKPAPEEQASAQTPAESAAHISEGYEAEDASHGGSGRPASLFEPPLRPGIPARPRQRPRSAPSPKNSGVRDAASSPDLTDDIRAALDSASTSPRPTFTSDLVPIAGSESLVEMWEAERRSDISASPVRFIAPKSRHRHRGRLVVSADSSTGPSSSDWWSSCVDTYRAGRLYELGVLLRALGDDVVSLKLEPEHVVVRLNGTQGMSAALVLLAPFDPLEGDVISDQLPALLEERLSLIAILSASGEKGARERIATAASRIVSESGSSVTVVAAVSWEYADDPKSAAVFVR